MSENSGTLSLTSRRLPALDALRVWGTLLVLLLHAGVPYIPETMVGLFWPIDNGAGSPLVADVFWSIESFIMPLFFAISGVSTYVLLQRKGTGALLDNRRRRILMPFLILGPAILLVDFYVWNLGDVLRGHLTWRQLTHFSAKNYNPEVWGFAHLWYLVYLLIYTLLLVGAVKAFRIRLQRRPPLPLLIAPIVAAACLVLARYPIIVIGFEHSFFPVAKRLGYFAMYFAGGVMLVPAIERAPEFARRFSLVLIGAGLIALVPLVPEIRGWRQGVEPRFEWLMPVCMACAAGGLSFGLTMRAVLSRSPGLSPQMTYASGAAFWVYLVHQPLCGIVQLRLDTVTLDPAVKFIVVSTAVLVLCLASYHVAVRNTRIGVLLNGRKVSERRPTISLPEAEPLREAA